MHPMELLGDVGHVESLFSRLEIVLVSVVDRCMVSARRTIGSEIVLDAPNGTTSSFWMHPKVPIGDKAQVEAHFGSFGHSANLNAR